MDVYDLKLNKNRFVFLNFDFKKATCGSYVVLDKKTNQKSPLAHMELALAIR